MDSNIERWYSMKEICEYLGVSRDTVLAWIDKREMPATKIGKKQFSFTAADGKADTFVPNLDEEEAFVLAAEGEPVEDNGYTLRFCTYKNRAPKPL